MILTSHSDTAEWLATFALSLMGVLRHDDVLLAQSAVDRFKNAGYDFGMEGDCCPPPEAQAEA